MPDLLILLLIVLAVVLIWRGPKTLPEWGRMLGRGVREARREASNVGRRDRAGGDRGGGETGAAAGRPRDGEPGP